MSKESAKPSPPPSSAWWVEGLLAIRGLSPLLLRLVASDHSPARKAVLSALVVWVRQGGAWAGEDWGQEGGTMCLRGLGKINISLRLPCRCGESVVGLLCLHTHCCGSCMFAHKHTHTQTHTHTHTQTHMWTRVSASLLGCVSGCSRVGASVCWSLDG